MEKIYGYKEKDIIGLAQMIMNRGNQPLSSIFNSYAIKNNKAKGTVRNLYYALVKRSNQDAEFCVHYLGGKPISAKPIVEFDKQDEIELVKKVLLGRKEGRSVRSVIMEMAGGDGKLALRYQNKYRNAVKYKKELIAKILLEINCDSDIFIGGKDQKETSVDLTMQKIKREINGLISKTMYKISKENEVLKEKVSELEKENTNLKKQVCSTNTGKTALQIFHQQNGKSLLS